MTMSNEELAQAALEDIGTDHDKAQLYVAGKLKTRDGQHWLAVASPPQKAVLVRLLMTGAMNEEDERTILMVLRNEFGTNLRQLVDALGPEGLAQMRKSLRSEPHREVLEQTLAWMDI